MSGKAQIADLKWYINKPIVCVGQIKSIVCRGMTYHLCPSCADKQHRTSLLENENDSGSPGFSGWASQSDKSLIPQPEARVHPHTRNRGNAAPAKEADDLTEEERDTELWFSNWKQTKNKCTKKLAQVNCPNLAAVMTVLCKSSSIRKTEVGPSGFVPPAMDGRQHHGLFVRGKYVVNPGEICAVICSNEEYFDIEPSDRQSYHIQAQRWHNGYYVVFSINPGAMLIGGAANGHFHELDPPNNAVYKQFNVVINNRPQALTVLVAIAKIQGNTEVVVDYGSGFGKDTQDPMFF